MCNEKTEKERYDYRFLDYRLDQIEIGINKKLEKLEAGQVLNNKELTKMLQALQENNNEQNKQLVEIRQRQKNMEEKLLCVDKLKEVATSHNQQIIALRNRLDVYKEILFLVAGTAVSGLIMAVLGLIFK